MQANAAGYAEAAERFARLCARAGVRRLVYLSTVAVYGPRRRGTIGVQTLPQPADDYARSRLDAERRIAGSLAGSSVALVTVRVPTVVGAGMSGTVLARFSRAVRWGVFLHPGPADAAFACIGVQRLAQLLLRLGEAPAAPALLQFSDHVPWPEIARLAGARWRLRLPTLGGRLEAFASTARYADDSADDGGRFPGGAGAPLPTTREDLVLALQASPPRGRGEPRDG